MYVMKNFCILILCVFMSVVIVFVFCFNLNMGSCEKGGAKTPLLLL